MISGTPIESAASNLGNFDSQEMLGRAKENQEKTQKFTDEKIKEVENTPIPKPPKEIEAPNPANYHTDPIQTFGSGASMLAIFGSLLTKKPLTTALKSAGAVMQARNQQDADSFKEAMEKFKVDVENARSAADYQLKLYESMKGKPEEEQRMMLAASKDTYGEMMLQYKMLDAQERMIRSASTNLNGLKIGEYQERKDAFKQEMIAGGMPEDEADKKADFQAYDEIFNTSMAKQAQQNEITAKIAKIDWEKADPNDVVPNTGLTVAAVKQIGDGIARTGNYSQAGLGYGWNPAKQAVDGYIAKAHPDFKRDVSALEFLGKQKEEAAIATRSAPAQIAVKEMDALGQPMIDAVSKLDTGKYPDLNAVETAYQKKTGGPEVVAAALAVQEFKTAFTNLMVRNGVPTDQARSKADDLMDKNFSLSQIKAVVKQAKLSGTAVIDALASAKDSITGEGSSATKPVDLYDKYGLKKP